MTTTERKFPAAQVDYRNFRLSKINQAEYRHLKLLLFWPIYFLRYPIIEAINTADRCFPVSCWLDELIPFHEAFFIPYQLWMVCLLAMTLYTMLYDIPSFKKYIQFLIISFSISTVVYLVFPTCQNLRPTQFERDNILTRLVQMMYRVDTNTNVCPSEHVIGSLAFLAAAINTKSLRKPLRLTVIAVLAVVISLSTVFLKQHSMVDVIAAIPVCAVAYWFCYLRKQKPENHRSAGGKNRSR